jgi:glucans biosynthesis protein
MVGRTVLVGLLLLWSQAALSFDFNDVAKRAEQLAASPFKKPDVNLPKELETLDYDKFRDIRFKPEKSHWRSASLPFELTFFHQGWHYNLPVKINEINSQ